MKKAIVVILLMFVFGQSSAAMVDFNKLYQSWGARSDFRPSPANAQKGRQMWSQKSSINRSCSGCHTNNLRNTGSHVKTKKRIKPMAPSVNSRRLTKVRKINKWLKRNCKFTYKRECSLDEKINFIEFIRSN